MHLTIDDVYGRIGHFGNRQKIYFFVLCSLNGWCAFHQLLTVFVGTSRSTSSEGGLIQKRLHAKEVSHWSLYLNEYC